MTILTEHLRLPSDQGASGRSLGAEEIDQLARVISSGVLTSTKGTQVAELERRFADRVGAGYAVACASGTGAVHSAIAAVDPEPGDEIITSPVTDMGAIAPILYQSAVPVFADVDPRTLNVTAATIADRLSERTRAIVVTHLFGNPCEMAEIVAVADERGVPVIEDCAQAYGAEVDGRPVGTIGAIGCFSLQQGKHITCGEGGLVVTDDAALARRMRHFVNKAWGYGEPNPDHTFLALNNRMTELQGAVAVAQLAKLDEGVANRIAMADLLTARLGSVLGVHPPLVQPAHVHSYWRYALRVDDAVVAGGAPALGALLGESDIASAPRYIQKPAFRCAVFRDQRTFGRSRFPFTLARAEALDWSEERFPGTFEGLEQVLVLPWNERYGAEHVDLLADGIRRAATQLADTATEVGR